MASSTLHSRVGRNLAEGSRREGRLSYPPSLQQIFVSCEENAVPVTENIATLARQGLGEFGFRLRNAPVAFMNPECAHKRRFSSWDLHICLHFCGPADSSLMNEQLNQELGFRYLLTNRKQERKRVCVHTVLFHQSCSQDNYTAQEAMCIKEPALQVPLKGGYL